ANAFGVTALDGCADVEGQSVGRNQADGQLTGMQRDVNLGINAVQLVEHPHVQIEVAHGHVPVFRHDEVEPHETWVRGREFEAEDNLREYGLLREAAENLIKIADGYLAARPGLCCSAVEERAHLRFSLIEG